MRVGMCVDMGLYVYVCEYIQPLLLKNPLVHRLLCSCSTLWIPILVLTLECVGRTELHIPAGGAAPRSTMRRSSCCCGQCKEHFPAG